MTKAGDTVHWTHESRKGKTISMDTRSGTVVSMDGDVAVVKRGARQVRVHVSRLRCKEEKTELTSFVEELARRIREKEQ